MSATETDRFKERINKHLQEVGQNDKLFAETLKKPHKSLEGCIKYIYSEVRKTGRCGFEDEEIFTMAIHYYDEDSIEEVKNIQPPKVSHTPDKPKASAKMEEYKKVVAEALKKPEKKSKQLINKSQPVAIQGTLF